MEKLKEFCKKLYDILEIFQNFEKNLKNLDQILKKFFEISLFAYSFQQTFQIIMYPVKIFWGRAPPPSTAGKIFGGPGPLHGPPMEERKELPSGMGSSGP